MILENCCQIVIQYIDPPKCKEQKSIREVKVLSTPISVCDRVFPSNSQPPPGYPTIKLNSDTIYLEIASDPTG